MKLFDLVFLRLALYKNYKSIILVTPFGRQAWDFSNDLVIRNVTKINDGVYELIISGFFINAIVTILKYLKFFDVDHFYL